MFGLIPRRSYGTVAQANASAEVAEAFATGLITGARSCICSRPCDGLAGQGEAERNLVLVFAWGPEGIVNA